MGQNLYFLFCKSECIWFKKQTQYKKYRQLFLGNPIPEAKWVLRGRIVTNNTSPLHGSGNQQYVIQEEGEKSSSSFLSFLSSSSSLPSPLHIVIFIITTFVTRIPRWVPEMVQPYLGQYLCG